MKTGQVNIDPTKRYRVERISPVCQIMPISYNRPEEEQKKKTNNNGEYSQSFHELFADKLKELKEEENQRNRERELNQIPFEEQVREIRGMRR